MVADSASPVQPQRLSRLDGLRGLAACFVAFPYHGRIMFDPSQFAGSRYGPILAWAQEWGWTFVDLFFVLSGYVFAHVYLERWVLNTRRDLADFAVARIARLYPLHLVMLLLVALFTFGRPDNGPLNFAANLVMLQAFIRPFAESFNGPSWSLSVEAFCYVLFAFGALAGRRVLIAMTVGMVALNAWRLGWLGLPGGPYVSDVVPRGFLGFFVGQGLWHLRGQLARVPSLILALAIELGIYATSGPISPFIPLTMLAWPAALVLALRLPLFGSKVMVWLGDRSYAIYLVNLPLIWCINHFTGVLTGSGWLVLAMHGLLIALTLVLSDLSLRLIEQPSRRAIRKAWDRRSAAPSTAALTA